MNSFDMEFVAPEEIELTDNPGNVSAFTLEANVHIVDQKITHTKELTKREIKDKRQTNRETKDKQKEK